MSAAEEMYRGPSSDSVGSRFVSRRRFMQLAILILSTSLLFIPLFTLVVRHYGVSSWHEANDADLASAVSWANARNGYAIYVYQNDHQFVEVAAEEEPRVIDQMVNKLVDRALTAFRCRQDLDSTVLSKHRLRNEDRSSSATANLAFPEKSNTDVSATRQRLKSKSDAIYKLTTVGQAAATASVVGGSLLMPITSMQTRIQASGLGAVRTAKLLFERGAPSALHQLYKALPTTVALLGMQDGLIFGSGALIKQHLPDGWSETARDAVSMGFASFVCSSMFFPLDTVKTRLELGKAMPSPNQLYRGFAPAMNGAVWGRAMWMASRNSLENSIPDHPGFEDWKHFACGGLTGAIATCTAFPFDTVKKRLQSAGGTQRKMLTEAHALLSSGGLARFYSGVEVELTTNFARSAIFNSIFVACSGGY